MAFRKRYEDDLLKIQNQQSTLPVNRNLREQVRTNPDTTSAMWSRQNVVNSGSQNLPRVSNLPNNPQAPNVPAPRPGGVITPRPSNYDNVNVRDMDAGTWNGNGASGGGSGGSAGGNSGGPPLDFTGSSNGVNVNNASQEAIREQMNQNSIAWWDADEAGRAELEAANRALAALLGDGVTFDPETGYWTGNADYAPNTELPEYDPGAVGDRPTWNPSGLGARPTWTSQYDEQINQMMAALLGRDPFSYNYLEDPIFQQYADMYTREGNRAMNDTLASAASGAGGMNSYALSAAQQANNYYMAQLGDKIPELYQLAYQMYMDEIGMDRDDINMLMGLDSMYYDRYRDKVGDWYADRDFSYGAYRDQVGDWYNDRDFNYNAFRDSVADQQWQTEFDYGVSRDQVEDSRYDQEWEYNTNLTDSEVAYERVWDYLDAGVMPSEALLAAAGMTVEEATAILAGMGYGSGGGGSGGGGGAPDDGDIEWGGGYDTQQGANGVAPSEWGYVKNNILTNLRAENWANVDAYLDQIAGQLSRDQWNEIAQLLIQYGYPDVPTY